jgi:hypothetical protein
VEKTSHPGFDPRTVQPVVSRLYRLHYPGPHTDSSLLQSITYGEQKKDTSTEAVLCKNAENIRYKRHYTDQTLAVEPEILLVLTVHFDVLEMWLFISVLFQIVTNFIQVFVRNRHTSSNRRHGESFNQDNEIEKSDKSWIHLVEKPLIEFRY